MMSGSSSAASSAAPSPRPVSEAYKAMQRSLSSVGKDDVVMREIIRDNYRKKCIGDALARWTERQVFGAWNRWKVMDVHVMKKVLRFKAYALLKEDAEDHDFFFSDDEAGEVGNAEKAEAPVDEVAAAADSRVDVLPATPKATIGDLTLSVGKHLLKLPESRQKQAEIVRRWVETTQRGWFPSSEMNESGMVTLGERAGPLIQRSPGAKIFHDSDPSYKLGVWIVLEGLVNLERSGPAPHESGREKAKKKVAMRKAAARGIVLPRASVINSTSSSYHTLGLEAGCLMVPTSLVLTDSLLLKATEDSKLMCFGGFQANAGAGGAILLKLKREVFSASLGAVVFARREKRANLESIRRFLTGILLDKKTSISETTLTNLIGRLADSATAIASSRQAMLTSRAGHLGILRTGSVSIIAKRTGLRSGSEKTAVISDPGSIVNYHSSGSSRKDKGSDQTSGDQALSQYVASSGGSLGVGAAGSNSSKKRGKRKKTTFAHQAQVTSATATVVYIPLSALEVGSGNHSLRTKLANIVSEQNTERLKRLESAQGVLKNMDKSAEADHDRRRSALKSLSSGLKQAEALKAHVNDFMDWKKELDKSMEFDDLNLSPVRPSLTVTSPSKLTGPRWSWSHQQRDLTGNERFSARRDADMLASPSKYAVASNMGGGRHTFYQ